MIRTVKRAGLVNHSCRQGKYVKIPQLGVLTVTIKLHSLTNLYVQKKKRIQVRSTDLHFSYHPGITRWPIGLLYKKARTYKETRNCLRGGTYSKYHNTTVIAASLVAK